MLLRHPAIALRDCEQCQKFLFDERTGRRVTDKRGNPVPRPKRTLAPCRYAKGICPKGTPEKQRSLSARNLLAYQHYLECKATGDFPSDPIVRRDAAIIRRVEDEAHEERLSATLTRLISHG